MGLVEKVQKMQADMSKEDMEKQQEKMKKGDFTLDDFRVQFVQVQKMGMKNLVSHMPGMANMIPENEDPDAALKRVSGMIDSMTKEERRNPNLIDLSRRRRIAGGSGVQPHEIKQFLTQFDSMRNVMKQMATMSMWQKLKMMTGMGQAGAFQPGGEQVLKTKGDTGHRKSPRERAEDRKKKKKGR